MLRSGPGALSFSALPVLSDTGTLAFTLAPDTAGHATFEITVTDPAGPLPPPPSQRFLVAVGPAVWRVAAGASGSADGSTWSDAIPDLTQALDRAVPGDQVWVATGTYRPSSPTSQPSFRIPDAIQLFGGFAGNETDVSQRNPDPLTNGTILDGYLLGDDNGFDNRSDNAWHVVRFDGVGSETRLDGVTIRGGEAVGLEPADFDQRRGGGVLITGSPVLCNLHLTANRSTDTGGALYSKQGGPHILDCHFENNESGGSGGSASFDDSSSDTELLVVARCHFLNNRSSVGGALSSGRDELLIRSCRFENNIADETVRDRDFHGDARLAVSTLGGLQFGESLPESLAHAPRHPLGLPPFGRHDREPRLGCLLVHDLPVVAEDHLRRVAGLQRSPGDVAGLCYPVADERVSEGILTPSAGDPGLDGGIAKGT